MTRSERFIVSHICFSRLKKKRVLQKKNTHAKLYFRCHGLHVFLRLYLNKYINISFKPIYVLSLDSSPIFVCPCLSFIPPAAPFLQRLQTLLCNPASAEWQCGQRRRNKTQQSSSLSNPKGSLSPPFLLFIH